MKAGPERKPEGRVRRLLWFVALYAVSLGLFTLLVYGMRALVPR